MHLQCLSWAKDIILIYIIVCYTLDNSAIYVEYPCEIIKYVWFSTLSIINTLFVPDPDFSDEMLPYSVGRIQSCPFFLPLHVYKKFIVLLCLVLCECDALWVNETFRIFRPSGDVMLHFQCLVITLPHIHDNFANKNLLLSAFKPWPVLLISWIMTWWYHCHSLQSWAQSMPNP